MEKFLESVAADLWQRYGERVEQLKIVLPNVRTRLFFVEALSRVASRPIWSPAYISIDTLMCDLAELQRADSISALTELFKIYATHHPSESFDSFYRWGEVLMNDFDSVDKYLIDAPMLFSNIVELKEVDADLESYMDSEQIAAVRRFWREFDSSRKSSQHKQRFLEVWNTLLPIYKAFRERLSALRVGYTGMIYRRAAERLRNDEARLPEGDYVVVGFNALSAAEKVLFDHLMSAHSAQFYWDYDSYYIDDDKQEAGLFLRENLRRYPMPSTFNPQSYFATPKQINVVATASDSLQCKYVGEFVEQIVSEQGSIGKNTAIVLTNEGLLSPLLYSLPDHIGNVNVTMGYPLKATLAYSFVERLLQMQLRIRTSSGGKISFYHSDVEGLLAHPFILAIDPVECGKLHREVLQRGRIYVEQSVVCGRHPLLDVLFASHADWPSLKEYLIDVLGRVLQVDMPHQSKDQRAQNRESIGLICEAITKLDNSIGRCEVAMEPKTHTALLRRVLQGVRIPYSGEPLNGVQVMGILETRNLDFDNVVVLSMNDDNFPSSRLSDTSFIPYNLRFAYGMPTPSHNEGVYAYYFYRLIQRASRIDLVYCSVGSDRSSGERSRYIYQLDFESPHRLQRIEKSLNVNLAEPPQLRVAKQGDVMRRLMAYVGGEGGAPERTLSPSSLNRFLRCSLQFYFSAIAGLRAESDIDEDVDNSDFGNIAHKALELLYKPMLDESVEPRKYIPTITREAVHEAVIEAVRLKYFNGDNIAESEYGGNVVVVCDTVEKFIFESVLPYDASPARGDYRVRKLEYPLQADVPFAGGYVRFEGNADRIDRLSDGSLRVIDYKTGKVHKQFKGLEDLISREPSTIVGPAMQTFIYSLMVDDMQRRGEIEGCGVTPSLYFVRFMGRDDYSPLLHDSAVAEDVACYADYAEEFRTILTSALERLFDPNEMFEATDNVNACGLCDYRAICRK